MPAPAHRRDNSPERDEGESSRRRRLKAINAFLTSRGLRPFANIGNWKQGEVELVRATGAVHENPWYSIVSFQVIKPDGGEGFFHLRFHAQGGTLAPMVVVPVINEEVHLLTREYRVACTDWFTEYPRAFAVSQGLRTPHERRLHELAQATMLGRERAYESLPLCVITRKLGGRGAPESADSGSASAPEAPRARHRVRYGASRGLVRSVPGGPRRTRPGARLGEHAHRPAHAS